MFRPCSAVARCILVNLTNRNWKLILIAAASYILGLEIALHAAESIRPHASEVDSSEHGSSDVGDSNGGPVLPEDPKISEERDRLQSQVAPLLLARYNRSLADMASPAGEMARTVILTTWRTGSTFLGQLLSSHPGSFYSHEPLFGLMPLGIRKSARKTAVAVKTVGEVLKCRYHDMPEGYFEIRRRRVEQELANNEELHRICSDPPNSAPDCFTPDFLSGLCSIYPIQVLKEVRLPLSSAEELLKNDELSNVRVVYLVRDPRAVMQSRKHVPWCRLSSDISSTSPPSESKGGNRRADEPITGADRRRNVKAAAGPGPGPSCFTSKHLCAGMEEDCRAARRLARLYPGRIRVQRYEDLVTDFGRSVPALFRFAGLSVTNETRQFLRAHTEQADSESGADKNDKFPWANSAKDSEKNAFKWVRHLGNVEIENIQKYCIKAMKLFGYKPISKDEEFTANVSIDRVFDKNYSFSLE